VGQLFIRSFSKHAELEMEKYFISLEEALEKKENETKEKEEVKESEEKQEEEKQEKDSAETENTDGGEEGTGDDAAAEGSEEDTSEASETDSDEEDSDEESLQDKIEPKGFYQEINDSFTTAFNDIVLGKKNSSESLDSFLNALNIKVENRTKAKFSSIVSDNEFSYYLHCPISSGIRKTLEFNKDFDLSKWMETLNAATDGELKEDGSVEGSFVKTYADMTLYIDFNSLAKVRHLTKEEALSVFFKFLADARNYVDHRANVIEVLKQCVRLAVKIAKKENDIEEIRNNLSSLTENNELKNVTTASTLFQESLVGLLEPTLRRAYAEIDEFYTEDPILKESQLIKRLPSAISKMSGTTADPNRKSEHTDLIDACLDIMAIRRICSLLKLDKEFEVSIGATVSQRLLSLIGKEEYLRTKANSGLESDRLIKHLISEAVTRLKKNEGVPEKVKAEEIKTVGVLIGEVKKEEEQLNLMSVIATESINSNSVNLRNYSRPALEMIHVQSRNDATCLAIDAIFEKCLAETNTKKIEELLAKIPALVEKRFGIKLSSVKLLSREFNFYAIVPIISETSQLVSGLYNFTDFELIDSVPDHYRKDTEIDSLLKRNNVSKVSLDRRNAKWTGLENIASENVFISLDVGAARRSGMTARELSAVFFHELGHVFTYYEYMYNASRTNILISEVLTNIKDKGGDVDYVFVRVGELSEGKVSKAEVEKLMEDKSKLVVFLGTLAHDRYSSFSQDIRGNLMTAANSEQLADSFASRLGYESEILLGLDKLFTEIAREFHMDKADLYKNYNSAMFSLACARFVNLLVISAALKSVLVGMASSLIAAGPAGIILLALINIIFTKFLLSIDPVYKGAINTDLDYNSVKRTTRAMRESIKRLKDISISRKEKLQILKSYGELEALLAYVEKCAGDIENHSVVGNIYGSVVNALYIKGIARSNADLYYTQIELEKLLDNKLFLSAARLDTFKKS
jgi:hypothetical protein